MRLPGVIGLALVAGLGSSACAHHLANGGAARAAIRPADDPVAAELREHHRHHHFGGVVQFVAMSLDTLGADDARRPRLEKLQGGLHACMAPVGEIERKLLGTVADGVASGAVDAATVDATIAQLATAIAAVHDCSVETIGQLHEILSATERAALVDKVQAHWEVWRQVNHEAEPGGREPGGRLAELAGELDLSADQTAKISAALRAAHAGRADAFDPKAADAHVAAFARAFVRESFDARSVASIASADVAARGDRRMAIFYETAAPLLTPEQRATLAAHLREHASHQPPTPDK